MSNPKIARLICKAIIICMRFYFFKATLLFYSRGLHVYPHPAVGLPQLHLLLLRDSLHHRVRGLRAQEQEQPGHRAHRGPDRAGQANS